MAIIKEKLAFGIFKDGLRVKVAQLSLNNGVVSIQSLEETTLSSELLHKELGDKDETVLPIKQTDEEIKLPDLDEIEDETFSLPELTEFEEPDESESPKEITMLPGLRDLQNFLQQFPLEKGKLSINANDEQISYFQFDSSYGTKNLRKRLLKELLTKEEIKSKDYSFDYILYPDNSGLAFVHTGQFRFFHALRDINLILSKEKYYYSYIDTNAVSLINLVNHNYDFSDNDYVLILYIGYDYKVGIVLKNGMHIKTFPIIVPDDDEVPMREVIFSKVLLEQDISDIPIIKNILIAGDNTTDEDLEYFRSESQEGDNITRIDLELLTVQEELKATITPEKIARYAIPIASAWKALEPRNKNFSSTNLLPTKVIENQKYFKIAWHGFLVMAAIFYFAFYGTIKNLELKQNIHNFENKNNNVKRELAINREMLERLNEIKVKVDQLQKNIIKVDRITGTKNQWNHILYAFSRSLHNNSLSWLNDLTSNNEGFTIEGYTTNRRAVIALSKLLPQTRITNVVKFEDNEFTIWRFILSIKYPDPKSWKDVEQEVIEEPVVEVVEEVIVDTVEAPEIEVITETPDEINEKYHSIVSLYFSGRIDDAYNQFSEFVKSYPQDKMAYNAKYLIGECLYLLGRYPEARDALIIVLDHKGNKSPDALIMLGNCSEKENDPDSAIKYWTTLIANYPNNDLAKAARYKIDKIKGR